MTNPTQHEKTLAIAKAMYGDIYVFEEVYANGKIVKVGTTNKNKEFNPYTPFNPYTSAEDSQAVQEFFKKQLRVTFNPVENKWLCKPLFCFEPHCCIWSEGLKEVIADGAYEVIKEK